MQVIIIKYDPAKMMPGTMPRVYSVAEQLTDAVQGTVIVTPPGIWFEILDFEGDGPGNILLEQEGRRLEVFETKGERRVKRVRTGGEDSSRGAD